MYNGTISGTLTWNPNGSLQKLVVADPFNAADVQTCNYSADDLSRLASVNCMNGSTNVWAQNFSYDAFGNLTKQVPNGGTGVSWTPGYSPTTNRYLLTGTSYDANGSVLNDGSNKYTWDAEGKPLSTAYAEGGGENWAFTYDAFGHMVERSINGAYSGSYVTLGKFKLSAVGQNPNYSEYPFPGGSIMSELGGATGVQLADWLGTARAFYSYTGGGYGQSGAHAPFGEAYGYNGGYPKDFTGQENDGSMSNTTYYFPERQLRSSQGRWLSPDPAGLGAVDPSNPQSWNRYAYVTNNPLALIDPTGNGGCGPGGVPGYGGGGCNTSGNFPCLICGLSSWDPLSVVFWAIGSGTEGSYGLFVPFGSFYFLNAAQNSMLQKQVGAVKSCVNNLYNINMQTFVPVEPGSNGYLYALDANGNGITIETDTTESSWQIGLRHWPPEGPQGGRTLPSTASSQVNYVANDPSTMAGGSLVQPNQLHEDAHALDMITSGNVYGTSEASADRLMNCINASLGVRH